VRDFKADDEQVRFAKKLHKLVSQKPVQEKPK
jgi:hypothetical protein